MSSLGQFQVAMTEAQIVRTHDLCASAPGYSDIARLFERRMDRIVRDRQIAARGQIDLRRMRQLNRHADIDEEQWV